MLANVEIKLHREVPKADQEIDYKILEKVIDLILEEKKYEVLQVKAVDDDTNQISLTKSSLQNITFLSIAINLNQDQIDQFEEHEDVIMEKVLEKLGERYLIEIDRNGKDED